MPTKKVETQEASPPQDIFEMNMRALEPGYFISTGFPRYGHHYGDMSRWFNNCDGYTPEIRRACWHSYHTNGFIRAATDFWVSLPTLDRTIQTKDRKRDGVSLPNNFLRDKQKMSASLDRLRDKVIMRDALLKYRLDGAAAYYFTTNQRYSNQKFIDPIYWALRYELNAYNNDIEYNKDIADKKFNEINEEQKEIFLKRLDEYALGYAQVEENKSKKSSRKEKSVESNAVNIGVQNCTLFPLNIDYVRFIGLRDGSFQIAFDLWYFYISIMFMTWLSVY